MFALGAVAGEVCVSLSLSLSLSRSLARSLFPPSPPFSSFVSLSLLRSLALAFSRSRFLSLSLALAFSLSLTKIRWGAQLVEALIEMDAICKQEETRAPRAWNKQASQGQIMALA